MVAANPGDPHACLAQLAQLSGEEQPGRDVAPIAVEQVTREDQQRHALLEAQLDQVAEGAPGGAPNLFDQPAVGALGGTFSTPIINYPEVAILGLGRTKKTPVLRDGQLAESLILPMSMSFDHRVTDGAEAAEFMVELKRLLENPMRLML